MQHAHIVNGTIETVGNLPRSARRLDTRQWVLGLDTADTAARQACGWYEILEPARPTPAGGNTVDRSIGIVNGEPTWVWTERPKTADELASDAQDTKEDQQEQRIQANFQQLRQTPPAASLTNAQLRDEVDLLRAVLLDLTRVVRGIAAE